ncbi:hypothetical protein JHK84_049630 [Glycine max]|uniref:Uncharacterized protein n=1 Tax=Glycine soja TaxID=3848 RepID=A0A445FQX5_GLYSO|nr:uncharacterized protein LOC114395145 [Glycine soja]KAG4920786.1 hypothetical protein JHK86_049599 [Glycine max]KAG4923854.1 hypothetical protein JHK87_049394 [Glycine soja]KAG5094042.1 hypothetical protein JHK84_049630 [Glycine max]KAH1153824.1 hypothetical protein GYH30_049448 [Glycine max]RZB51301.1 hypothetical protein D0Y65_047927 [Glycine soja]
MEAVGSRLSRASSRYGAPTVFSGPVRKWKKKWVHVTPSSLPNNSSHSHTNNSTTTSSASSRLLLRRWTPATVDDAAGAVSDEPPRRKFRYTPVVVLEEQKKMNVVKAEHEPTIETDQLAARQTNVTHEMQGKLNMNEMLEETKDSNIGNLDLGSDFQSNTGGNSQNSDAQLENSM